MGFRVSLLIFSSFSLLLGQSDRGTITGRVLDIQSSPIPNVIVVARSQATNVRTETRTNESGVYSLQQLPVGNYEVTAEAPGFRKFVARDLTLNVAQTFGLDIKLELGQMEQTIEVTAGTTTLQTATSDLGTTISRDQVMDLPLAVSGNMRNPEAFLFLAPGVTGDASNTQINGSQSRAKEVLLDGAGAAGPESGGILFTYPSVEVIGEFKLLAANFNAEYGRTGGGFEVFTTRSGTNDYHGALFEYFRNDALDARGFFSPTTPVNRQNEFGANFSGPVLLPKLYNGKNKTFFFFNYTGFRFRAGQVNQFFTVPTAAMARGDFSGLTDRNGRPLLIYDPATTVSTAEGFTRQPFPGNIIPQERFSAVSRKILPLLPTPTNSRQTDNFLSIGARTFDRDQVNIKIDHAFSDKARVNWFSYIGSQSSVAALGLPIPFTNALDEQRPSRWLRFNFDYIFSPTLLNNFIIGYTREPQLWSKLSANQDWPNRIGLTGINTGPGNVFPRVTFTDGLSTWADDSKNVGAQVNNMLQMNDSLSIVRGKHVFKAGVEARWQQTNGADPFGQQGQFAFSQLETSLPTAAARAITGHAFASFLLGNVDNASYNALVVVPGNRYRYLGTYFQDDWKITRKLTLNLGFRYDIFFPRVERFNNFSSFDPAALNPSVGGRLGAISFLGEGPGRDNSRRSFADTYYRNFGPRFGFAYLLRDKTVLRGGYGIFYAPGNATAGLRQSQRFAIGFNGQPSYQSPDLGVTPGFNWDQGFPTNWPKPPFIDPTVANGTSVDMIGRNDGRPPYFQNWTFNIQHELPGAIVVDLDYVGNKGTRLGNGLININEVDPRYLSLGALLTRPVTSAEAQAAGIALPYAGFTGSVAQALRPYPQYLNIANRSNPNGNSTYHAFQMKVEKRMTRGLTFLGAYTFSKSISDSDIQAGGGPTGITYYNRRLEKGISTNDVPHILNLSFLYDLPFGRTKAWGGWSLTGILQYATGKPIVLTATNALPLFNGGNRPDVLSATRTGQQDNFDPAVNLWINPAAFSVPGANRFGTSARSYTDLRAPNFLNESFGLIKRTRLGERTNLIFRAEFFNAFNRVVFAAPAANISNQNFGRISAQANTPRQGQLALRLEF